MRRHQQHHIEYQLPESAFKRVCDEKPRLLSYQNLRVSDDATTIRITVSGRSATTYTFASPHLDSAQQVHIAYADASTAYIVLTKAWCGGDDDSSSSVSSDDSGGAWTVRAVSIPTPHGGDDDENDDGWHICTAAEV